jgi:hypothetical protein
MKSQELYLGGRENGWGRILVELLKLKVLLPLQLTKNIWNVLAFFLK